jgi:hyperosmotically inducible protein
MRKYIHVLMISLILPLFSTNAFGDDKALVLDVKSTIFSSSPSMLLDIDISTQNGVVSLSGTVPSTEQANTLIELAQSTPGVTDVNISGLKIKDGQPPSSDSVLSAKVKGAFIQQQLFGSATNPMTINISVKDGTVSLTGKSKDKAQAENATAIARKVAGVKHVDSKIEYMDMTKNK